jgi:hypothetical protein
VPNARRGPTQTQRHPRALADHVTFSWWQLEWYEEERVVVHVRDPHHRVDTLHGSPRARALAGGRVVVESVQPLVLFETIPADPLPMPKLTLPTATADPVAVTSASAPRTMSQPSARG